MIVHDNKSGSLMFVLNKLVGIKPEEFFAYVIDDNGEIKVRVYFGSRDSWFETKYSSMDWDGTSS